MAKNPTVCKFLINKKKHRFTIKTDNKAVFLSFYEIVIT